MTFQDILISRYATQVFDGRRIPDKKIEKLKELILLSPSSFNMQPWKIKIASDPDIKEQLRAVSWDQPQITSCSHLLVLCARTDLDANLDDLRRLMATRETPSDDVDAALKAVRGALSHFSPEARLTWAEKQVYILLANTLNAAKSLGFDSCPMEGIDAGKYDEILGIPQAFKTTAAVAVGYAKDKPWPKLRFPKEDLFI